MNKFINTTIVLAAGMLLTLSCQESKGDRFEREAREYTEKKCPQKIDTEGIFVLDSVVFDKLSNTKHFYNSVMSDETVKQAFEEKKNEMYDQLLSAIINDPTLRQLKEEGITIVYSYADRDTGDSLGSFTFTKDDYEQ